MNALSGKFKPANTGNTPSPTYYAVGDIHGRLDLLNTLLDKILDDAKDKDWRIVFLGDYVDRGPDSKGVIQRLIDLKKEHGDKIICLRGNHEEIFHSALQPNVLKDNIEMYMGYGLDKTIRSYGVAVDVSNYNLSKILKDLRESVPVEHLQFLRSLKDSLETEHAFFSHAGINPYLPLDKQGSHDLRWGNKAMIHRSGKYDKLVVHGHYATRGLEICHQRICIDSGAVWTDKLTCCVIAPDGNYRFMQTGPKPEPNPTPKSL